MPERLLSLSEVLLFGRVVEDIAVRSLDEALSADAATTADLGVFEGLGPIDGVNLAVSDKVLVVSQNNKAENGLYTVRKVDDGVNPVTHPWQDQQKLPKGTLVNVTGGATQKGMWQQKAPLQSGKQRFKKLESRKFVSRSGKNKQLDDQLSEDAGFARIYGFAFEGTYYELPEPTLFLVHGDGESATDDNAPDGGGSRAPLSPSQSGVASAEYQISNDIRVWAYDKADYSIRMDTMTGMVEQVLLDVYFGFDEPSIVGAKVSGAKVSGAKVSGAKVSGAKVSGAKARGPGD